MLNRISVEDFLFNDFNDYFVDVICSDGKDEKFSVDWYLYPTTNLVKIADELRTSKGFMPMFSKNTDNYDNEGWYSFSFTVECDVSESDSISEPAYILYFWVATDLSDDDCECYSIVLSENFEDKVVSHLQQNHNIDFKSFLANEYLSYKNLKEG